MKKRITKEFFAGNENGVEETVKVRLDYENYEEQEAFTPIGHLRNVLKAVGTVIDIESYPDRIRSPYDCTGQAFGSNWKRIYWTADEDGFTVLLIHSYAYDV